MTTEADRARDDLVVVHRASDAAPPGGVEGDAINAIRFLAIDAVERAKSGHPGTPMGLAPLAYRLFTRHLRHDPAHPDWPDRDRFVLSGGHASMLLYALLHLCGYDLSIDDLKAFRQWGSRTPGHPERGITPGVEVTTGPLGQGFANAVGMAMAERMLAARFNRPGLDIVDHRTFAVCGEGDMMEGIASEAASLAGRLHRPRQAHGLLRQQSHHPRRRCRVEFAENVGERFEAYGWHVAEVSDANALGEIDGRSPPRPRRPAGPARPGAQPHRLRLPGPGQRQGARRGAGRGEHRQDPRNPGLVARAVRDPGCGLRAVAKPGRRAGRGARRLARALRALPGRPSGPGGRVRARDRAGGCRKDGRDALPSFAPGARIATRVSGGKALDAFGAESAGAGRRLRRRDQLDPHGDQRLGRRELRRLDRAQHPLRRSRARDGRRSATASPRMAACGRSARPSSRSATT